MNKLEKYSRRASLWGLAWVAVNTPKPFWIIFSDSNEFCGRGKKKWKL
jgi:hypothetical protein